MIEMSLKIAP